jgi:CheY-like chemotaxis protein
MGIPVILVIEDNFADVTLLRLALDELGTAYRLEIVRDGEAASSMSPITAPDGANPCRA